VKISFIIIIFSTTMYFSSLSLRLIVLCETLVSFWISIYLETSLLDFNNIVVLSGLIAKYLYLNISSIYINKVEDLFKYENVKYVT
jgi:hypothetical protein